MSCQTEAIKAYRAALDDLCAYFTEHDDIFSSVMEELDDCTGVLDGRRYYSLDDFNELHAGVAPWEILRAAFYGYDDRPGRQFNPNRDFFYYNVYGNLVSDWKKDYSDLLDYDILELIIKWREDLPTADSVTALHDLISRAAALMPAA